MAKTKSEKHWESKALEYRDYSDRLVAQLNKSIESLRLLAVGATAEDAPSAWSSDAKVKDLASKMLVTAVKNIPKGPTGFFYP